MDLENVICGFIDLSITSTATGCKLEEVSTKPMAQYCKGSYARRRLP